MNGSRHLNLIHSILLDFVGFIDVNLGIPPYKVAYFPPIKNLDI
jgi:hypothetical protein